MEDVEAFAARAVAAMNDEGLAWVGDPATVAALLSLIQAPKTRGARRG